MGLFSKKSPVTRVELIQWCAAQMGKRAGSLEAQEVTLRAQKEFGLSQDDALWKFFTSQWDVVVNEVPQNFGARVTRGQVAEISKDLRAMTAAVHVAGRELFPLTYTSSVEWVLSKLAVMAPDMGWRTD